MVFLLLPWQLSCALFAMITGISAAIAPSNQSTAIGSVTGTYVLQTSNSQDIANLVPLTTDATNMRAGETLPGNLHYTTVDSERNISNTDIAYISCDTGDYNGFMDAFQLLNQTITAHNLSAVILYSIKSSYCGIENATSLEQSFPIFSMTTSGASSELFNLTKASTLNPAQKYFVTIRKRGGGGGGGSNDGNGRPQNPLGPSPSTAVAMIILYSITGIITALFLVIIITGAVRAHRHPDRYGPRNMLGQPRQSRARGLGRAILDTLPIVKFGERDPPKPTDVELGSTAEARNVDSVDGERTGEATQVEQPTSTSPPTADHSGTTTHAGPTEQPSGIAAAETLPTGAAAAGVTTDEGLGCSICTEDFEKGQDIRVLPCDHKFHPECVDPWLLNVSGTCPLCRVDLRPTLSNESSENADHDTDVLAPPLGPEAEVSHRRRTALRDILSLRSRPNASAEERISALRRLREQRRNQSGDVAESASANGSVEDVAAARRSRRISVRLSGVFGGRAARRHGHDDAHIAETASTSSSAGPEPATTVTAATTTTTTTTPPNADSDATGAEAPARRP
ncbi:hypothetical protein B0J11DRAFT_28750 [Dendryphion nanum]|uniref:RING-type domain-containing protein n=1 Tax=Dendryphion nanum TaxID=256645 RepID=A0A9P9EL56_9PLEO|nr:hypothetical protein B0J11DRAFT_28750 [Dendryphion nanum]